MGVAGILGRFIATMSRDREKSDLILILINYQIDRTTITQITIQVKSRNLLYSCHLVAIGSEEG